MARNGLRLHPRTALVALALLATGAVASMTVTQSVTMDPGQQFDNYVLTIGALPAKRVPVAVNVVQPTITGGGLVLVGWEETSERGQYAFSYTVDSGRITDSTLVITNSIPADGTVTITNMQATSTVQMPVFDFREMSVANNVTVDVRSCFVSYSGHAIEEAAVQIGGGSRPTEISYYSTLQVHDLMMTGGSCVLAMTAGDSQQSVMTVTHNSLVGVDAVNAAGVSRAALCADSTLIVSSNSVLRVTSVTLAAATIDGAKRTAMSVIDSRNGVVSVADGSMLVVRSVSITGGYVLGSSGGAIMQGMFINNSTISFVDVHASDFCSSCSVEGFPASIGDNSYVYAQDWVLNGSATTNYMGAGLGYVTPLTDLRDASGRCRPAYCLPANSLPQSDSGSCVCNCKPGTFAPMCLDNFDPLSSAALCADANCIDCSVNAGVCSACRDGFAVSGNTCLFVKCDVVNCQQCVTGDSNSCGACQGGYGLVGATCQSCSVPYCTGCDGNTNACAQCVSGFELSSDKKTCTDPTKVCRVTSCAACQSSDNTKCATCGGGYGVLSNGQCGRCGDANCLKCNGDTATCSSCASGYTLTAYGTCSPGGACGVTNCAYCKAGDTATCATCISGYVVNSNNGNCVASGTCLVSGCNRCAAANPNYCSVCNDGYALNSAGQCVISRPACQVANCNGCANGSSTACASCYSGYVLTGTGQCTVAQCLVANCAKCRSGNAYMCDSCGARYTLSSSGTCVYVSSLAGVPARALVLAVAVAIAFAAAVLS